MDFGIFSIMRLRWVVRSPVNVEWDVPGFRVWHVFTVSQEVTSRKFTIFLLASIVIFRPNLPKMLHNSFLMSSVFLGDALVIPRPSSLYKPKLHALPNFSLMLWRR